MNDEFVIVGLGCRMPGADSAEQLRNNLMQGLSAIGTPPADRFKSPEGDEVGNQFGGFVNDAERFDANYFGISPREAETMDPQQCLALEVTATAMDDAALTNGDLAEFRTGVFAAASLHDYSVRRWTGEGDAFAVTGSANSAVANRVSHWLDAHGPSVTFDTACSSSLVATHYACTSLRTGDCDFAIVVGASVMLLPNVTDSLQRASVVTRQRKCQTFDASADGYVRGEGAGAVIITTSTIAQQLGLRAYASLHGHAVNHNGRGSGFAAPNVKMQVEVMRRAHQGEVSMLSNLAYIEAMGASTRLGDMIELKSIRNCLDGAPRHSPCAVGSLKPNIGHLEAAAGMASLIKVATGIFHGAIPKTISVDDLNPGFALAPTSLTFADQHVQWHKESIAGINAFALGGGNAHVLLREPQSIAVDHSTNLESDAAPLLLTISACSSEALLKFARLYADAFQKWPGQARSLCRASHWGASHRPIRLAIVATDGEDVIRALLDGLGSATDRLKPIVGITCGADEKKASAFEKTHTLAINYLTNGRASLLSESATRYISPVPLPGYPFDRSINVLQSLVDDHTGAVHGSEANKLIREIALLLDSDRLN